MGTLRGGKAMASKARQCPQCGQEIGKGARHYAEGFYSAKRERVCSAKCAYFYGDVMTARQEADSALMEHWRNGRTYAAERAAVCAADDYNAQH